jgi:hypothetical protein
MQLAGINYDAKNGISLFVLFLKDYQIFIRLSQEHKELRSVEIFRLSFMVPEI